MKNQTKISDKERIVLEVLAEEYDGEMGCFYFRGIKSRIDQRIEGGAKIPIMDLRMIRLACRSLSRKGLAEYTRGLFDEDGMVAGSGYCATEKGAALICPCDLCENRAVYEYEIDEKGESTYGNDGIQIRECREHYKKSAEVEIKKHSQQKLL